MKRAIQHESDRLDEHVEARFLPRSTGGPRPRILLADDNADLREYVTVLLARQYEVVAAADGGEALRFARNGEFDLILADVMMPGLDGLELTRELRADERLKGIPVILISARAGEEAQIQGIEAGADDYIVKPFGARELLARIGGHLQMFRIRQEAATAERQLRAEAQEARARLESVLIGITDQFLVLDPDWRYVFVNDRLVTESGLRKEELLGKSLWELFPALTGTEFEREARRAMAEKTPVHMEMFYAPRNRWYESHMYPTASGLAIIGADITERKLMEHALAESARESRAVYRVADRLHRARSLQDVYGAALDAMIEALGCDRASIMLSDEAGVMRFVAWRRLSEEYRKSVESRSPWMPDAIDPDPIWVNDVDGADLDPALKASIQREGIRSLAYIPLVTDGRLIGRFMTYFKTPHVFNPRDTALSLTIARQLAFGIDRKRAEEQIARLLAEEQAAREEAEQATRAKDEFLAIVSHELRSPLNAILGWNRLLRSQHSDDPQITRIADTVERNGKAQLGLIDDLLDTARIISGKMKLQFQPVQPVAVISAALDSILPAADSKGIAVTTDLDPDAGQITGDPDRLQQVMWNLLSNAIKFTPAGGSVRIELRRGGPGMQIMVSDTGQGIAPDLLPHVFERFRQGDSHASRRHGGLGLGLALSKHLVELHGGSVVAQSPGEDKGATFTVNLPMRAVKSNSVAEPQHAPRWSATGRVGTPAYILKGLRALVVDDDAGARELLTTTLSAQGMDITDVDSMATALAVLESQLEDPAFAPFDILISDIGMPGGDGYEVIRKVREHPDPRINRIRAIALTAYARSADRLRALRAGFHMHVPKPVDEEELTTVVATLTNRI